MKFGCYLLHIFCLGKGILKVMTSAQKLTLANSSLLSDFCHLNVMFVCLLPEKKPYKLVPLTSFARWVTLGSRGVVSKTKHSKTKTAARSTQISKTKHLNLENEALENEAPETRNHCRLNNCNFTSSMGQAPREKITSCLRLESLIKPY